MKRKIIVIANNDIGLHNFRKEVLEYFLSHEYEVDIILPHGEKVEPLIQMGCIFHDVPIDRRGTSPVKDFRLFLAYKRLLSNLKPDVVLTYTIKPNIYGGFAAQLLHIPYIANVTGLGTAIENPGILQKITMGMYRVGLKRAKCVFFQNAQNKRFFETQKVVRGKSVLLPGSGVNLDKHIYEKYPADVSTLKFLFVGRLMRDKGIGELIDAAQILSMKYKNLIFKAVGFVEKEYEQTLKEKEADKYLELCGQQDDVHSYMKEAHAIILPSYHEGMANVLLEAAACGRPVLASKVPGCVETFDEGISGYGFEPGNAEDLVRAIEKFIALSPGEMEQMGLAGRRKMEREFDRKIVINAYAKEIKEC